jgi:hypothetical protein
MAFVFNVTASDSDISDVLLFTWYWGDQTVTVTLLPEAAHKYLLRGDYELMVWVDDQTGKRGHNLSDSGLVSVSGVNQPPVIVDFSVDDDTPFNDQIVTFSGTATDANLDLLWLQFNFGDGFAVTLWQSAPGQTLTTTHTYPKLGTYATTLAVSDSEAMPVTSSPIFLVVEHPPYINITLLTGWNQVSIPLVGYGYNASTLGLSPGDTVARWNSATKTYTSHIVGVPVNDFPLIPHAGYWINVPSGTRTLSLYGNVPNTTQTINITVPMGGGWSLIGFLGFKTWHASDIPKMWNGTGSITTVAKYNPIWLSYISWLSTIPTINDYHIIPGQAVWVLTGGSGTLTYLP